MGSSVLKFGSRKLNRENWSVYHPNGSHMYTCGENKVKWYLSRGLAHISGDKKIIFNFIPNGDWSIDVVEFYRSVRIPQCVVTGVDYNLQRHHIVPYCYRTFLPEKYKSRSHHDVVLINNIKHMVYEKVATEFKNYLSKYYNIPTILELNRLYCVELKKNSVEYSETVKNISKLLKLGLILSNNEKIEIIDNLSKLTNIDFDVMIKYNYLQFLKLLQLIKENHVVNQNEFIKNNKIYYEHGYHIIKKLDSDEKIDEFIKLWRNHFINIMNPQFMPAGWSINFKNTFE